MAVRVSTAVRNAMVDAAAALINAGSAGGVIRIYTGAQPAGPGTAASGDLLAEIDLSDPAYAAAVTGSAAIDTSPALTGIATGAGTAGWARVLDSDDNALVDCNVSESGGGGDLILDDTAILVGASVTITSLPLSVAASA